jgi:gliding motility-associated-like protein
MSQDKPHFEDAFREALKNHETAVSSKVWAGVQSSLANTTAATTGSAILGKAAAVIGFTALITAATISEVQHATKSQQAISEPTENEMPVAPNSAISPIEKIAAYSETEEIVKSEKSETIASTEAELDLSKESSVEIAFSENSDKVNAETSNHSFSSAQAEANQTAHANAESALDNSGIDIEAHEIADEALTSEAASPDVVINEPAEKELEEDPKTIAYFTHSAETIFTPNGDGFHDYFEVEGFGVKSFDIRIMNRGGQVVFESNDLNFQWNGNDRFGQPAPEGVYFYAIQAIGTDGLPYLEKNSKGSVTLKR